MKKGRPKKQKGEHKKRVCITLDPLIYEQAKKFLKNISLICEKALKDKLAKALKDKAILENGGRE